MTFLTVSKNQCSGWCGAAQVGSTVPGWRNCTGTGLAGMTTGVATGYNATGTGYRRRTTVIESMVTKDYRCRCSVVELGVVDRLRRHRGMAGLAFYFIGYTKTTSKVSLVLTATWSHASYPVCIDITAAWSNGCLGITGISN